jgi:hyaluronoglucosaminidase
MEIAMPYTQARYRQALLWYWLQQHRLQSEKTLLNNLVAYWKLNETSSTRFDSTSNNNDLTDNNTVGSVTGKIGNAADFNGTNYLSAPNNATFSPTGHFTITAWVRPQSSGSFAGIAGVWHFTSVNDRQWVLYLRNDSTVAFGVSANGVNDFTEFSPIVLSVGTWYLLAAGWDGSNIFLSINAGTPITTAFAGPIYSGATNPFEVGAYDGGANLIDGRIDEIGLWHRALTAEEIDLLFNSGSGLTYPFV